MKLNVLFDYDRRGIDNRALYIERSEGYESIIGHLGLTGEQYERLDGPETINVTIERIS